MKKEKKDSGLLQFEILCRKYPNSVFIGNAAFDLKGYNFLDVEDIKKSLLVYRKNKQYFIINNFFKNTEDFFIKK